MVRTVGYWLFIHSTPACTADIMHSQLAQCCRLQAACTPCPVRRYTAVFTPRSRPHSTRWHGSRVNCHSVIEMLVLTFNFIQIEDMKNYKQNKKIPICEVLFLGCRAPVDSTRVIHQSQENRGIPGSRSKKPFMSALCKIRIFQEQIERATF